MYFLMLGVVLLTCKLAELNPVAQWSWWAILAPFPLASLWWLIADLTGYTKRVAEAREEERRVRRLRKHIALAQNKGSIRS